MCLRTVRERMDLIIDMMDNHVVDVKVIQETRLKEELEPMAKKLG